MSGYDAKFALPPVDVSKLKSYFVDERKDLVFLARQAELSERFLDMCVFTRRIGSLAKGQFTREERNLFMIAHKRVAVTKRNASKGMVAAPGTNPKLVAAYKSIADADAKQCYTALIRYIMEELLTPEIEAVEHRVSLLTFVADHYRYLIEVDTESEVAHAKSARAFYNDAMQLAEQLPVTDPVRLALSLNTSVFQYEVLRDPKAACETAKVAFDRAINRLDELDEEDYKDATLVMQLMRDNLALWVAIDQGQQPQ